MTQAVRIALVVMVLLSCSTHAYAQTRPRPLISEFEILGGVQINNPYMPRFDREVKLLVGPSANVGAVHYFSHSLGLSLNIQYESKGSKLRIEDESVNPPGDLVAIFKTKFTYVSGAIFVRWLPVRAWRIFIAIGPYYSHTIDEEIHTDITLNGAPYLTAVGKPLPDDYKNYDYGGSVMIGYDLRLKPRLNISVRGVYSHGFQYYNESDIADYVSRSFSLQMGVTINHPLRVNY